MLKRFMSLLLTLVLCLPLFCLELEEVCAYTSYTKTPNPVMTLKNLGTNKAVQQFYFYNAPTGERYVFTTQRVTSSVYLSRCLVSDDGLTATCLDYVKLEGFGHGEALAVSEYQGQVYVWVNSNTITDTTDALYTTTYWARNVSRFIYTPDSSVSTGARITDEKRLNEFLYATSDGSSLVSGARTFRMAFSISPNSDRIMFWIKLAKSSTYYQYLCCYRLSDINAALSASSGTVSMSKMGGSQLAKISYSGDLPNGSMQGLGIDGTSTLYFSGGSSSQTPKVYKYSYTASSITLKEVWTVTAKANVEIETAYMLNGTFYCIFIDDTTGDGKKNKTKIYTLDDYSVTQMHANHKQTIKGLPVGDIVQNFAYTEDMSQVFVSQKHGTDTYITRCIPNGNVAEAKDYIVLKGAGIGESLEIDQSIAGKTYLWTGGAPVTGSDSFATTIQRLEYNVDGSSATGASYTAVTIKDLQYASASGSALDSTAVSRVAVSATASGDNRIVFRTQFSSGDIYYTVYPTSTVNQAINSAGGNSYSLKDSAASVKSNFKLNNRPNNSFQGFEADGVGTDQKFLYMTGNSGSKMQLPLIYKYLYTNGGNTTLNAVYRLPAFMQTVQGLKVYNGTVYVAVQPISDNANQTVIRTLSSTYIADPVIVDDFTLKPANNATDLQGGMLYGMTQGLTNGNVTALFDNTNTLRVVDAGGQVVANGYVGTGYKIQSLDRSGNVADEAVIIVSGDVNGDANISTVDYLQTLKHIGGDSIMAGCYLAAGDLTNDKVVNTTDCAVIRKIISGN